MIQFEEALAIILHHAICLESETVEMTASLGRVLAADVRSDMDMPPFDKTAVDGFACRRDDLTKNLRVLEVVAAGQVPSVSVGPGECTKIMTGAMVPEGADCVIMVEFTHENEDGSIAFTGTRTANNICYLGEDVKKGEIILEKGLLIKPQHIAVLASAGCIKPEVYRKVKVGILSTGDEIVEPGEVPGAGKIRNSNAWQLMAQAEAMSVEPHYFGIAPDEEIETLSMIRKAMETCDVILLTGGISMGDFDFVPSVLQKAGFEFHFKSLAVQPGRPTLFGTARNNKFCFGLPGNPVSSFNQFELLVKPLFYKMMGCNYEAVVVKLPLATDYSRKKIGTSFIYSGYFTQRWKHFAG
jgi:molybdopterin molybdotransferase